MTEESETNAEMSYTYATSTNDTADFNLEVLQEVMKEFRQKFDDEFSRAMLAPRPTNPLLKMEPPKFEYEPEERPYALNWRFGMPVYESEFLPRGEGAIVAGHGVVIGTGPETSQLDKLGLDLGHVCYNLPKWAMFAILAAALLLLVLVLA